MPDFGPDVILNNPAYRHPSAHLYGKITIEENASIWINVVARAEHKEIVIGSHTNIQDFVILHIGDASGTYIGSHCSITHHCTIHGCTIGDNCLPVFIIQPASTAGVQQCNPKSSRAATSISCCMNGWMSKR